MKLKKVLLSIVIISMILVLIPIPVFANMPHLENEDGLIIAIDIFSGELEGLAYLEIEFENKDIAERYEAPNWVIKDVTTDLDYKNGHLSRYGIPSSFYEYMK